MKKFKTWIIHLLGGVTVEESKNSGKGYYRIGMLFTLADLKHYAESLNGKSADEWCKLMYEYIYADDKNFSPMELTKKDQRHIRNLAAADVFKVVAHASEYAQLYRIEYYKEVVKHLQNKINILEEQYNKTYGKE